MAQSAPGPARHSAQLFPRLGGASVPAAAGRLRRGLRPDAPRHAADRSGHVGALLPLAAGALRPALATLAAVRSRGLARLADGGGPLDPAPLAVAAGNPRHL